MENKDQITERLKQHRTQAPEGFADQVMDALPQWRKTQPRGWWPTHGRWIAPALSGAVATLLILLALGRFQSTPVQGQVGFHFELHAPGADKVELLGTFNNWKMGDIVLNGPDASGHWTATVELPEGRHEYIFLVDGERWMADPKGSTHRPDGFGRVNTVINYYEDNNA
jgi:hypothetical protein